MQKPKAITEALGSIDAIAKDVHSGSCAGEKGPFKNLLIIGIGGSALGPQFVADALEDQRTIVLILSILIIPIRTGWTHFRSPRWTTRTNLIGSNLKIRWHGRNKKRHG